ncbi:MAG: DUF5107 domain-containing protein [Clostridia bacterium]|nr:DUF5107 domain-containing protein [Clostridia bacterium]
MATELYRISFMMPCQDMNGTSSLPPLSKLNFWHRNGDSGVGEDDELFIGYGHVPSPYPYKMQDMYTRELHEREMHAVVLENEYLKATFLPEWGGKLMSLIDKEKNCDLLYCNTVMRPCNLAIRNAWTSGGVEWNCGIFGHNVHTCDTMFTTTTELDDGTPVLRMYEYERIRRVVQQMDFFLPEGSRMLYVRNRIINPMPNVVPMYWWSNIAVPETPDTRIVVNADSAYMADNGTSLQDMLTYSGADCTYPINVPAAMDFFYKIPDFKRRYEAALDADGYGLIQTSTYRLKGRKLFCWGQNPGGDRWQEYLTEDGSSDRYIEIQAGLAHTQYECLPMPPNTTWEWLEAYGAMNADGDKVHGDWQEAKAEVAARLDEIITAEELEAMLEATKPMAKAKAKGELMFRGSGWGALENMMRAKIGRPQMASHLDFGEVGEEQADWVTLMKRGTMPEHDTNDEIPSWMLQNEWIGMLEGAADGGDLTNWYTQLQLGVAYLANNRLQEAYERIDRSYKLNPSPWSLHALANFKRLLGDATAAASLCAKASRMRLHDASLAKEAMELLVLADMNEEAIALAKEFPEEVSSIGRVKIYIAKAYINLGDADAAEAIFYRDGGLVLPDIREGELIITDLYLRMLELRAKAAGEDFDRATAKVPPQFDYRQCETTQARPARKRAK